MCFSKVIKKARETFSLSLFEKLWIYLWIILTPLAIYIIEINNKVINIRKIREIAFYSSAIIFCSFLQKSRWLRYFIIWCVCNWWLNFFFPNISYVGLTNIFSALVIYIGIKYLIAKNILKIDIILRIICLNVIFQFCWLIMQMFNYDPIFYPINEMGLFLNTKMPLIGWSGNPAILGIFFASNSFLLLHYFKLKRMPIFFFIVLSSIFFLKNATAAITFAGAGLFYLVTRYKIKRKIILSTILITLILGVFFIYIKSPNYDRIDIWEKLIKDGLKLRPFVGKGINFFSYLHITDKYGKGWDKAHNDYLQLILELGLIGFVLFSGFMISRFTMFFKEKRNNLQICMMACLVAFFISAFSLFPMHLAQNSFYAILVLTCLEKTYETELL